MVKVSVSKIEWSPSLGNYVVTLKKIGANRLGNIPVHEWEAQIIEVLLNQKSQEPYKTASLWSYLMENTNVKVLRVEITRSFWGEILARVVYSSENKIHSIKHTPGEAIELAIRCRANLMVKEMLLDVVEPKQYQAVVQTSRLSKLKERLKDAVALEQYEKAALIRDKIMMIEKKRGVN